MSTISTVKIMPALLSLAASTFTSATSNSTHYTLVVSPSGNWLQADEYCQIEYGTHLASIHSQADQEEVGDLCGADQACLIGLSDRGREGVWKWIDGSANNLGMLSASASSHAQQEQEKAQQNITRFCSNVQRVVGRGTAG